MSEHEQNQADLEQARKFVEEFKVNLTEAFIMVERQKVYGDPKQNHRNIAMMIAPILQPHADKIAAGEPIPEWAVALVMCQLKMSRMRIKFHDDNYVDLINYAGFARAFQKEDHEKFQAGYQNTPAPEPEKKLRDNGYTTREKCKCPTAVCHDYATRKCKACGGDI